ncbi:MULTISPECIES: glucan ABC transporter ATP-binding protein/ permease [unclassified Acidocella]|uniref:glucan ABC transporter ATP-binding protein/ permease n=1 Tax=unclassified Acidocella TaxID=2648610 RepID=UPI00034ADF9F|nr:MULTISPECIES: glucan ABC transporter ATP-binding protein/ permease [unclassified Acidocella]WBO58578.1 glucan ABC transporter ATP-binding protein/ permease [Acidocella sp. MX-AZ03]
MKFFALYARVLGLLRQDRAIAWFLVLANLAVMGFQFAEPVLFGRVINLLTGADAQARAAVVRGAVRLLGLWAMVGLASIGASIVLAVQAERLAHRNRLLAMSRFYQHVLSMPPAFHTRRHSGQLMKIMLSGADALFWMWLTFFKEHLATALAILLLLPLTLVLNWRLALALILLVVLFCALTAFVITRTETAQRQVERHQSNLAGTAQDTLANVLVVQAFTRLTAETTQFRRTSEAVLNRQIPVLNWWALLSVVTSAASTITIIVIFMLGTLLHLRGQASVGAIVTFMGFAMLLVGRLTGAMGFISRLFLQMPTLAEFFTVLDAPSLLPEAPGAKALALRAGAVRFEHVSFGYQSAVPIVEDLDFTARPGSVTALVGATGAGKSTTMALLQRYWDPSAGAISIDGQDLRAVTLDSLRGAIGVVFQDAMLFNRSIRENLLIGRPDATPADIHRACEMAEALNFIEAQPEGFETLIGERGVNLSGGQKQRLAIARAILKNPPILILDEATSALDAATEASVSRALRQLMQGRTSFVVAHRLSTIRDADEILVFAAGRIVERGTFQHLLAQRGVFAHLVETQLTPEMSETNSNNN